MLKLRKDIQKYYKYMLYSAKSQLKAEVANSYLSWIWWVLEPFCFMLIYTVIFGYIFASTEKYFPIYIFIGNTMWGFFSKTISACVTIIRNNETIISRVYIPKYILVIVEMLVNGFKMLISFGLTAIMMIIFKVHVTLNIFFIIPVMCVLFLITFALGNLLMHLGVYINDLAQIMNIFLSMMMYFTGIFFSIETKIAEPFCTLLGICNPIAFLLTSARKAIMYESAPNLKVLLVWFVIAIILTLFSVRVIYKNENSYVKIL